MPHELFGSVEAGEGIAEDADEMCSFVQKKANNQWL
jgi:hypothetical protein